MSVRFLVIGFAGCIGCLSCFCLRALYRCGPPTLTADCSVPSRFVEGIYGAGAVFDFRDTVAVPEIAPSAALPSGRSAKLKQWRKRRFSWRLDSQTRMKVLAIRRAFASALSRGLDRLQCLLPRPFPRFSESNCRIREAFHAIRPGCNGPWCNGNTAPFGGVIHGSNPCGVVNLA